VKNKRADEIRDHRFQNVREKNERAVFRPHDARRVRHPGVAASVLPDVYVFKQPAEYVRRLETAEDITDCQADNTV